MINAIKRRVKSVTKRGGVSGQVVISKCKTHDEDLDFHCNDCDDFICTECIKSEHKDHNWDSVKKLATQKKSKLPEKCEKLKNDLNEQLRTLDEIQDKNSRKKYTHLKELLQMEDKNIEKIRKNTQRMKEKCQENEKVKANAITEMSETLKQQIRFIDDTVSHFEKHKQAMSDTTVIETDKNIDRFISEMTQCTMSEFEYSCHIYEGAHGTCDHLLGNTIDSAIFSITELSQFNVGSIHCMNILPRDENKAICISAGIWNTSLYLYKHDMRRLKLITELSFLCRSAFMPMKAVIFIITPTSTNIKKVDLQAPQKISEVVTTAPLMPVAMCASVKCGFLLSLVDEYSYEIDEQSDRIVQEMNLFGDVLKTHRYLEGNKTLSFTFPSCLAQNINTDICVVDKTSEVTGMLKIISTRTNQCLIYEGFDKGRAFDPGDVVCDSEGFIIVTDTSNSLVHLLDTNGKFMKYLLTEENGLFSPTALGINNSSLWVGSAEGIMKIYHYSNTGDSNIQAETDIEEC